MKSSILTGCLALGTPKALSLAAALIALLMAVPALACGGMPVVAPEPMPPSAGDSWSFLPDYQPGESLYDRADQNLGDTASSTCDLGHPNCNSDHNSTVAVDGSNGTADVFTHDTDDTTGLGSVDWTPWISATPRSSRTSAEFSATPTAGSRGRLPE